MVLQILYMRQFPECNIALSLLTGFRRQVVPYRADRLNGHITKSPLLAEPLSDNDSYLQEQRG